MQKLIPSLKKYPLSWCCIALIWILSLTPIFPETPFDNVAFIDKWTHLVMYGGTCSVIWFEYLRSMYGGTCSVIWFEYLRHHNRLDYEKLFFYAFLLPILMSGLLELLQAYCTGGHRNGDWLDFAANSLGVLLGNLLGWLMHLYYKLH